MKSRSAAGCRVLVRDIGIDAALVVEPDQEPTLVVRPGISFGAAVRAIMQVAPDTPPGEAEALVRRHLPDAFDLDDLLRAGNAELQQAPDYAFDEVLLGGPVVAVIAAVAVLMMLGVLLSTTYTRHEISEWGASHLQAVAHSPVVD